MVAVSKLVSSEVPSVNKVNGQHLDAHFSIPAQYVEANARRSWKVLGQGSYGQVLLGTYCGSKVAVKCLKTETCHVRCGMDAYSEVPQLQDMCLQHLWNEMLMLGQLQHPHIVSFLGAARTEDNMYLLTEFCARGSVDRLLYRRPQPFLTLGRVMRVCLDTARALAYMHSQPRAILHCDLKPANLLVTSDWRVKVADFGNARFASDPGCMDLEGTVEYCAPEVLSGDPYTKAADVWSFGVTLWELLMQQRPYQECGLNSYMLIVLIASGSLTLPAVPACLASPALIQIVKLCLQPCPEDRPSFQEIVSMLESDLEHSTSQYIEHTGSMHRSTSSNISSCGSFTASLSGGLSGGLSEGLRRCEQNTYADARYGPTSSILSVPSMRDSHSEGHLEESVELEDLPSLHTQSAAKQMSNVHSRITSPFAVQRASEYARQDMAVGNQSVHSAEISGSGLGFESGQDSTHSSASDWCEPFHSDFIMGSDHVAAPPFHAANLSSHNADQPRLPFNVARISSTMVELPQQKTLTSACAKYQLSSSHELATSAAATSVTKASVDGCSLAGICVGVHHNGWYVDRGGGSGRCSTAVLDCLQLCPPKTDCRGLCSNSVQLVCSGSCASMRMNSKQRPFPLSSLSFAGNMRCGQLDQVMKQSVSCTRGLQACEVGLFLDKG